MILSYINIYLWAGYLIRYSDWLRDGRSGIESRFSFRPDRAWGPPSLL